MPILVALFLASCGGAGDHFAVKVRNDASATQTFHVDIPKLYPDITKQWEIPTGAQEQVAFYRGGADGFTLVEGTDGPDISNKTGHITFQVTAYDRPGGTSLGTTEETLAYDGEYDSETVVWGGTSFIDY